MQRGIAWSLAGRLHRIAGEIRVCTSCHGLNDKDQAGGLTPVNPPQALTTLLQYWKTQQGTQLSLPLYLPLVGR